MSIALVSREGTPQLGVVYDPVEATLLHAVSGDGAFRDRRPLPTGPKPMGEALSVFADRGFLTRDDHDEIVAALDQIAHDMGTVGVQLYPGAGAVMNACGVLAHPPACYFKHPKPIGGGSLWDFAATACVFNEAGAVATDIQGAPLDLNRPGPTSMNHRGVLFATNKALADRIRAIRLPT